MNKTIKRYNKTNTLNKRTKKVSRSRSISFDKSKMKEMSFFGNGNNKYIPEFKIINGPAFATVVIYLKKDQEIYDQKGAVNYADSTINVNTKTGGFFKGLYRALLTSESMFMTYYTGVTKDPSIISFASVLAGDMFAITIKPGKKYLISPNSFVCATKNVVLNTDVRFKNIFLNTNIFLSVASLIPDIKEDGMIWISAYGGYERLYIPEGKSIKIDHGQFCFSDANLDYALSKMGGLKTFFLGDSGFFMEYKGPCEVYVNCRNINQHLEYIKKYMNIKYNYKHKHKD